MHRYKYILLGVFLGLLGLAILYFAGDAPDRNYENDFEQRLTHRLNELESSYQDILATLDRQDLLQIDFNEFDTREAFYIYRNDRLIYWKSNTIVPDVVALRVNEPVQYYEDAGWKGLIKQWTIQSRSGDTRLLVFLPLLYQPPVPNRYLTPWYEKEFLYSPDVSIQEQDLAHPFTFESDVLFRYDFGSTYKRSDKDLQRIGAFLLAISFALLIFVIHRWNMVSIRYWVSWLRLLLLSVGSLGTVFFIKNWSLGDALLVFDSRLYASSEIFSSPATLIILSVLMVEASILFACQVNRKSVYLKVRRSGLRMVFGVLASLGLLYAFSIQFFFINDFYHSSQVSLDIYDSLSVTPLRMIGLLAIVALTVSLYFLFNGLFRIARLSVRRPLDVAVFVIASSGMFWFQQNVPYVYIVSCLGLYLVLLVITRLYRYYAQTNYRSLLYLVSIIVVNAALVSYSVYIMEKEQTLEELKSYANQTLIDEDVFAEYLINEAVVEVENDPSIANFMTTPFVPKGIIGKKVRQQYLARYLEKYRIQILIFNQEGTNIDDPGMPDYKTLSSRFKVEQNATDFPNVYQVNRLRNNFFKRYLAFIEIRRYNTSVGYLILDLDQKKVFSPNVYPELLVDMRVVDPHNDLNVSYAIYDHEDLLYEGGDYNYVKGFSASFLDDKIFSEGRVRNDYLHVAIKTDSRVVVVSAKGYDPLEVVSNFSFLFLIMTVILGVVIIVVSWLKILKEPLTGFAVRIQLFINLAFILPLLLVTVTTVSLLNRASEENIQMEYLSKAKSLGATIQQPLDTYQVLPNSREDLIDVLQDAANIMGTDADLYNLSGGLITSTQPEIYSKRLRSRYIDPVAFHQVVHQSSSSFTKENHVGNLQYSTTYIPIKTADTGRMVGILSLPFFNYKEALKVQQVEVFSNILNIFSLIFIVLLLLSYLVSRRLVNPLNVISGKLNKTSFSGYNEPIEWNSKDEIGQLVGEYNTMISNLAESREALARSERELAWREIAKHVAHEIKNPLTPMKLSLQQLKRRLSDNGGDNAWIEKPVDSLLHQVDVLRDIASSFSAFAKMPIPQMKPFDISELLKQTLELHRNEMEISVRKMEDHVIARGDEKLMGRIITNILLNARQAGGENTKVEVSMSAGQRISISLKDNGPGIPDEIVDKIFLPGFSTKETGSGIGLSVAKHGIEQSGGTIWFETSSGGTVFFIELPRGE